MLVSLHVAKFDVVRKEKLHLQEKHMDESEIERSESTGGEDVLEC
jgi:hypothetical protein